MYKLINGWTKETVMAQVKKYNNGTKALNEGGNCVYLSPSGNRCAVGCFIPDEHSALSMRNDALSIIRDCPDLKQYMPFEGPALLDFQRAHDRATRGLEEVYQNIQIFLDARVS